MQTGDQVREETKAEVDSALSFINYFLLAFGAIALLVGTFIIYNTFSMIVAQRLRELALLRAIGASRAQVGRSVVTEALVVGLIGSIIGLLGGIGLAYGLRSLLNTFDVGLPEGPLQVGARTIIVALVVGVVVTTLSAYAPARRASKIPPVAAMREEFASTGDSLRVRTLIGAILGVIGVALLVFGSRGTGGGAALIVGLGAFSLIIAVLLGAPALSRPIVGALGAVFAKPFGAIGRLARTNAVRNPRRTAATAFALTLGLMLVTVIGVFGSSAKASINALVDVGVSADYILTGPNAIGVPRGAADAVRQVPDVQSATSLHGVRAKVDGEDEQGASFDGPIEGVLEYKILEGTVDLTGNNMLVSKSTADDKGWTVGSTQTLTGPGGVEYQTVVAGVFEDNQLIGSWIVSDEAYRKLMPAESLPDFVVLVKAKPGADLTTLRSELETATEKYVVVQVQDREEFKGTQGQQINTLLAILYGLLALAVVIAILGIINTLALSVVERRREIGMLRAVGMQRGQMRRTIYLESVLIADVRRGGRSCSRHRVRLGLREHSRGSGPRQDHDPVGSGGRNADRLGCGRCLGGAVAGQPSGQDEAARGDCRHVGPSAPVRTFGSGNSRKCARYRCHMSTLQEVGERESWRCWLCDEPVDPDMSVNDPRGPSIDSINTAKKGGKTKGGVERLAHRACNTKKGAVKPVVEWSDRLFVVDPAPIIGVVEQLERKGGRVAVARCPGKDDAQEASDWLIDRLSRLAPALNVETSIDAAGGGYLLVLKTV